MNSGQPVIPYFEQMKILYCFSWLLALPLHLSAQTHSASRSKAVHFALPVAATGRVTYLDTAHAPGVSAKRLLNSAYDTFARNLIYFDYPITPGDTLDMPRPHEPAAAGENVFTGSVLLFDAKAPPPVYVAGVSPPLDPRATYPLLHYVVFTLRLRAQEGHCLITVTDLRLRSMPFDYQMKRLMAQYQQQPGQAAASLLTHRLPGQPVEALYARWLPTAALAKPGSAKNSYPASPTETDARRLDETVRGVAHLLRRQMQALSPGPH